MSRLAFITGITGQDGSYLAELLLEKGYQVCGLQRRTSLNNNYYRIAHILKHRRLKIYYGDLTDGVNMFSILSDIERKMDETIERLEIYNLGAQSHVHRSFEMPEYTAQCDGLAILHILEYIRQSPNRDRMRFYQASTSELYGKVQAVPQNETTPFYPRSPYGVAKLYAFWITKNYRESYGIYATNGILFNHESPRRGDDFVTRKITLGLSKILRGQISCVELGNLNAERDWGHAKDYVRGMWLMLQHSEPRDWVLASGKKHTVRDFARLAFAHAGIELEFSGEGIHEVGKDIKTGEVRIRISPEFFRSAEVDLLLGDSADAHNLLGWTCEYSFNNLVKDMVEADIAVGKAV